VKFRPCLEIKDINGNAFKKDENTAAVIADFAITALTETFPGESCPAEKKIHRYNLAKRIKHAYDEKAEEIDLPSEDIALIKTCIGQHYPPKFVGPLFQAIEG